MKARYILVAGVIAALVSVALAAHYRRSVPDACPEIEPMISADPAQDAKDAVARGDRRFLMLGGIVGFVPVGVEGAPTRMLDGTGDVVTPACLRLRSVAERYALTYNQTIRSYGDEVR